MGGGTEGDPVGSAVGRSAQLAGDDACARSTVAAGGTELPARDPGRAGRLALAFPLRHVLPFSSRARRGGASTTAHGGASGSAFIRGAQYAKHGAKVGGPVG